jgi:hypothetical protein
MKRRFWSFQEALLADNLAADRSDPCPVVSRASKPTKFVGLLPLKVIFALQQSLVVQPRAPSQRSWLSGGSRGWSALARIAHRATITTVYRFFKGPASLPHSGECRRSAAVALFQLRRGRKRRTGAHPFRRRPAGPPAAPRPRYMGGAGAATGGPATAAGHRATNAATASCTRCQTPRYGHVSDTCNHTRRALVTTTAPTFQSR